MQDDGKLTSRLRAKLEKRSLCGIALISETQDDELKAYYTYGNELISQQRNSSYSYYISDRQLSTRYLTDENGSITDTYDYDAFGNLTNQTGVTENEFLYIGQQYDSNKLVKAVISDGVNITSEEYVYDCEGNRISKTTNEVDVTKYIVDSNTEYADVLAELDGESNVKCVYTHGDEISSKHLPCRRTWQYPYACR